MEENCIRDVGNYFLNIVCLLLCDGGNFIFVIISVKLLLWVIRGLVVGPVKRHKMPFMTRSN
jgi:hypothetical protein